MPHPYFNVSISHIFKTNIPICEMTNLDITNTLRRSSNFSVHYPTKHLDFPPTHRIMMLSFFLNVFPPTSLSPFFEHSYHIQLGIHPTLPVSHLSLFSLLTHISLFMSLSRSSSSFIHLLRGSHMSFLSNGQANHGL